jgi:hypothetical protein
MMVVVIVLGAGAIVGVLLTMLSRVRAAPARPPEAIVERFVQELAGHHYDRALPYLTQHLLGQTIPLTLEVRVNELERRTGALHNVRGIPQWSVGTRAYAIAEADSERAGHIKLGFGLVRKDGAWRIEELYDLGWKPKGVQ